MLQIVAETAFGPNAKHGIDLDGDFDDVFQKIAVKHLHRIMKIKHLLRTAPLDASDQLAVALHSIAITTPIPEKEEEAEEEE